MSDLAPSQPNARSDDGPPWIGQGASRWTMDRQWLLVTLAMLTSGMAFFGWRAAMAVGVCASGAFLCHLALTLIRRWITGRPARESWIGVTTAGLLSGLAMPMTSDLSLPVIGGLLVGGLAQVTGRTQRVRLHPAAAALLMLWLAPLALSGAKLSPPWRFSAVDAVLTPERMVLGDVMRRREHRAVDPWWTLRADAMSDAVHRPLPGAVVLRDRWLLLDHPTLLVNSLSGGAIARMEEVMIGCVPGPIGATSVALILSLGLYLMYRRLSSWPMAVAALLGAVTALLLMPPSPRDWSTVVLSRLAQHPPTVGVTYGAYMLLASPLPLAVMILAPLSAPMSLRGRAIYGGIIGAGGVALMWFTGAPQAVLLALAPAGLLARPLDALQRTPWASAPPPSPERVTSDPAPTPTPEPPHAP